MVLLLSELQGTHAVNLSLMNKLSLISLLESLLCTTLFTGMPYSCASAIVWRNSTVDNTSLELWKCIRTHNWIMIKPEYFDNNEFSITVNEDLLNEILGKITRNKQFQFPPVRQILAFHAASNNEI